ncbi:pyridoxal phosphate-dependent aminotransferase [Anaerosacchariphilus polymeriproducens]|uniref:Aminotransferase class I/II-fold pyridoxal phosphate-dependent enzyme n=1 Tax=Anaerosacchariphilus polymeriproducens TaxID=1812858 RepID=A0A371AY83_9FIRM|nr:threonine-phosphate decarboxylase [Anaerosacchariphilus polymeriproducens]RDU24544.1 aminotransferase class I/II-fold pyridoxal phosphate-dependent enzyme [Anaerosacchariphilus polymeriproducens]
MKNQIHGGDIYRNQGVLDFSTNTNPLGIPKALYGVLANSIHKIEHYPDIACERLRDELERVEGIKKEQIICGNGAAELIYSLVYGVKPKKALIQSPTFLEYEQALKSVDCQIEVFESKRENEFRLDEKVLDRIHEGLDMMFLCNPNNPTGILVNPQLMIEIGKRCKENEVILVLDECFIEFVKEPEKYSMKQYLGRNPWIFILKAFTKTYAMAGLRLGYGMTGDINLIDKINRVTQPWTVSVLAQEAGVAALKEVSYIKESRELVERERTYLKKSMKQIGFKVLDSQANYIFFQGPDNLYDKCLERGFLIRDCSNYRGLGKGYYRIAVKTTKENEKLLKAFMELTKEE